MDEIKQEFKAIKRETSGRNHNSKKGWWYRHFNRLHILQERNKRERKRVLRHYQNKRYYEKHKEQEKARRKERYDLTGK